MNQPWSQMNLLVAQSRHARSSDEDKVEEVTGGGMIVRDIVDVLGGLEAACRETFVQRVLAPSQGSASKKSSRKDETCCA